MVLIFIMSIPGFKHGLWRPDEPRVAGICAEMARTHDFCVPHLNGRPFLEKPPLYFALGAVSGSIFGLKKDTSYRIVSVFFAVLTLFITFSMVYKRYGPIHGLIAAGILASSWEFFMLSRWVLVDISLVFGVTLAMYAYLRWTEDDKITDSIMLGLGLGLSFMAKGLVGPGIIGAAIITDIIRRKDMGIIWKIRPFTILLIMFIPVLPWIVGLYIRGGWPFVRDVLVVNNIMRFTGAAPAAVLGHQHGILYYINRFPRDLLPWTFIFIPALLASFRTFRKDPFVSWFIGPFILLSIASTKRGIYLVPLYPAVACMITRWLTEDTSYRPWERLMVNISWVIVFMGSLMPFAGIFLKRPFLGITMGILSLAGLFVLRNNAGAILSLETPFVIKNNASLKLANALPLVLTMCIALFASTTVYFSYMTPRNDYIPFAREVFERVKPQDVTILGQDEVMAGLFSMVSGTRLRDASGLRAIKKQGYYVWADKHNKVIKSLRPKTSKIDIILEKKIGSRHAILAHLIPLASKAGKAKGKP